MGTGGKQSDEQNRRGDLARHTVEMLPERTRLVEHTWARLRASARLLRLLDAIGKIGPALGGRVGAVLVCVCGAVGIHCLDICNIAASEVAGSA